MDPHGARAARRWRCRAAADDPFEVENGRTALALVAIAASVVLSMGGYLRWVGVQRAVRRGEPLPPAWLVPVVTIGVLVVSAVAFVLVAVQ